MKKAKEERKYLSAFLSFFSKGGKKKNSRELEREKKEYGKLFSPSVSVHRGINREEFQDNKPAYRKLQRARRKIRRARISRRGF